MRESLLRKLGAFCDICAQIAALCAANSSDKKVFVAFQKHNSIITYYYCERILGKKETLLLPTSFLHTY